MKIYFITEGNKNIGFGHITRCVSLYQAFEEKGLSPCLMVNGDESIYNLLKDKKYEIFNWVKNPEDLVDKIKDCDIAIIDSYLATPEMYKKISDAVKISVYIDDNKRIDYPRGIVINPNIHAKNLNYPERQGIKYLLGTEYALIRKEFWDVPEKEIKEKIETIMVTFGGDDNKKMTPKVLKLLTENYSNCTKNVIVGNGFTNVEKIKSLADKKTNLIYAADANQMKKIMMNSDIAISGGGQTLNELAHIGVPTIAIAVVDNQINNVKEWQKKGFVECAGFSQGNIIEDIKKILDKLKSKKEREKKVLIGKKQVSGQGARKLAELLINSIK